MRRFLAFLILSTVKIFSKIFYRGRYHWLTPPQNFNWNKIRLVVLLNHTSLYEPLFLQEVPFSFLWLLSSRLSVPGADITLNRPIVGRFWKLMMPNIATVTRKMDSSWDKYLDSIKEDRIVLITPEGRMKRPNGLDKYGKPMTVRGGIADIIENFDEGGMLLCFSGGLHHVQAPGQHFPKLFKTIEMNFRYFDIEEYKKQFPDNPRQRKLTIVQDLQKRLENDCPQARTI